MDWQVTGIVIALVAVVRKVVPAVDGRLVVTAVSAGVGAALGAANALGAGADWKRGAMSGAASGIAAAGAVHVADRIGPKGAS